jgi:hypothetical protein
MCQNANSPAGELESTGELECLVYKNLTLAAIMALYYILISRWKEEPMMKFCISQITRSFVSRIGELQCVVAEILAMTASKAWILPK